MVLDTPVLWYTDLSDVTLRPRLFVLWTHRCLKIGFWSLRSSILEGVLRFVYSLARQYCCSRDYSNHLDLLSSDPRNMLAPQLGAARVRERQLPTGVLQRRRELKLPGLFAAKERLHHSGKKLLRSGQIVHLGRSISLHKPRNLWSSHGTD